MIAPRIYLFPAAEAPVVVAVMRVRSKWWHVVKIDGTTVERGSWFHGAKIFAEDCELSHDGQWLSYRASNDGWNGWSGLCRPPWLRCIASVHSDMPFCEGNRFSFPESGVVAVSTPANGRFSMPQNRGRIVGWSLRVLGRLLRTKERGGGSRPAEYNHADLRSTCAWLQEHGGLRSVFISPSNRNEESRMQLQGFRPGPKAKTWVWNNKQGDQRIIQEKRYGDHHPSSLHHLSCCIDGAGRWWQAIDGVISCFSSPTAHAKEVMRLDTREWAPPRSQTSNQPMAPKIQEEQ